jgi:CRP-like cAMP-binding protein
MTEAPTRTVEAGIDWFGPGLPQGARRALTDLGRIECYMPGAEVFREGEETRDFGIILSGRIALRVLVPERGQVTILTCEPEDIINWSAIVPPYRSTSTGIALERVEVLTFDGVALRGALRSDPELAAAVYPRVLRAVARRLVATRNQLLDLFARQEPGLW